MDYKFETRCIHRDNEHEEGHPYGSVCTPIYQTATFYHPGIGQTTGFNYTRESNPTRTELEDIVTSLEEAKDTVACANGMAAIVLCMELFESGEHIVCSEDLYGGSVRMFQTTGEKRGLTFTYVNTADAAATEAAIKNNTKALYIETPSNPTMQITDLAKMKSLADKYNLLLIVDNTFLSPYFQNPLDLGADIVVHSGTKYLGGHNDTLAGFLITNREDICEKFRFLIKTTGAGLAPLDSWLLLRGIKTLGVRMDRAQENAIAIAHWLKKQKAVTKVIYPGLPEHPGYEIMKKQARGFGAMLTFQLESKEFALAILKNVRMIKFAESLGGVETLITYPTTQTHADVPKEIREKNGITEATLRLSVGIENIKDLIAELEKVFKETEGELYAREKS